MEFNSPNPDPVPRSSALFTAYRPRTREPSIRASSASARMPPLQFPFPSSFRSGTRNAYTQAPIASTPTLSSARSVPPNPPMPPDNPRASRASDYADPEGDIPDDVSANDNPVGGDQPDGDPSDDNSSNGDDDLGGHGGPNPSQNPQFPPGFGGNHRVPIQPVMVMDPAYFSQLMTQMTRTMTRALSNQSGEQGGAKVKEPDTFDGSERSKLKPFLVQCQLNFMASPRRYSSDRSRINYCISYLRGTAAQYFYNFLTSGLELPSFLVSFTEFVLCLERHFGEISPTESAAWKLSKLRMTEQHKVARYVTDFDNLANQIHWGEEALLFRFYEGLPERIKDELVHFPKPASCQGDTAPDQI